MNAISINHATNNETNNNDIESYLESYYKHDGKKIHCVVDKILKNFGGITDKEHFYSLANEVFFDVWKNERFDSTKGDFDGFIYRCLENKIKSEMTKFNAYKRTSDKESISLDTPIGESGEDTIGDFIPDKEINEKPLSFNMEKYLESLTDLQREIVSLLSQEYKPSEIRKKLNLADKDYRSNIKIIRSYEKTKVLTRNDLSSMNINKEGYELEFLNTNTNNITNTAEKTKNTQYSIESICKKLKQYKLRDNHVLQRETEQWNNSCKSELISDILQGKSLTQIIISEEIKDNVTMYWLIDGKQRCTTIEDFLNNGFSISKNVSRYNIDYQTNKKDENGNILFNKEGFPIPERKTFDIRGKKFSNFPDELQDQFKEYTVPVMLNLNCSSQEIAYDIARFNRCRPMNKAQNGWLQIDEQFAEIINNMIDKMEFFKQDCPFSNYRYSNKKSGTMRRIIIEAIMLIYFKDNFNKDFNKTCQFLSENANEKMFSDFYILIERLSDVANVEIASEFNIKNSFLWFALFAEYTKYNLGDDLLFIDFMKKFNEEFIYEEIEEYGNLSFHDLNTLRSTKDKSVVLKKMNILKNYMDKFLKDKITTDDMFLVEILQIDPQEITDNKDFYNDSLDELLENNVLLESKLRDKENRRSLLAMMVYSINNNEYLNEWLEQYAKENDSYLIDQRENFKVMLESFNEFKIQNRCA